MFFDGCRVILDIISVIILIAGMGMFIRYVIKHHETILTKENFDNAFSCFGGIVLAFILCMSFIIIASVLCSNLANMLGLDASVLWAIIGSAAYLFSKFVSWLLPRLAPDFFNL